MSGNPEKPPIPGPGEQGQQLYPPPPSGAPPPQDEQNVPQSATSEHLPAYSEGVQQQAPPEKGAAPQQTEQSQPYYPPPPPGPPPTQQQQFTHAPVSAGAGGDNMSEFAKDFYKSGGGGGGGDYEGPPPPLPGARPNQQHPEMNIPQYNPANPQFAPPPQGEIPPTQHHGKHDDSDLAYGSSQLTPADQDHSQHRRSWGTFFTEMGNKAAGPVNALANKLGSQSFLPTTMEKECEKAAHIVKSFCKEGITSDEATVKPDGKDSNAPPTPVDGQSPVAAGKQKSRPHGAIVKIPSKVINKAQGLAIFTTARVGFNFSGATGSGILIARLPDGSWSPPSGIQVHALGAGFMIGVDIYDCVCVINSREALAAFMSTRVSLGPDVAVTAGPYGAGGMVQFGGAFQNSDDRKAAEAQKAQLEQQQKQEEEKLLNQEKPPVGDEESRLRPGKSGHHRRGSSMSLKPVFTYVKSRGFYAGIQVDGTVITERREANAAFYGAKVGVEQILRGEVPAQAAGGHWPAGAHGLYEALRIAETQQPLPDANLPPPPAPSQQQHYQQQQQYQPNPSAQSHFATGAPPQEKQQYPPGGQGPEMSGGASGPEGEQLPGYVDDGVQRPGVGDQKFHYQ